jgi:hypothetical protein
MSLELSAPLLSVLFNVRRVGGSKLELLQLVVEEDETREDKKSYVCGRGSAAAPTEEEEKGAKREHGEHNKIIK